MHIALISMPWNLLSTPSLPLGILAAVARDRAEPAEHHLNIRWAEHLMRASDGELTPDDYYYVADVGAWYGMGDWIFTPALYGIPRWRAETYLSYLGERGVGAGKSLQMAEHTAAFIDAEASRIASTRPDVIGFSTTFQQNVPSLALARQLKRLLPRTPILFGGGNCDMPMGPALQRGFPYVDYVISGEAEQSFVEFIEFIAGQRKPEEVSGLSWRDKAGVPVTNPPGRPVAIGSVPCPDFTAWQEALDSSAVRPYVKPTLVYEAARGCWWGEKHTCTFCGLNGLTMQFRSRPPEQVTEHLEKLVRRHQILDIIAVDNILDMAYLRTVLPHLINQDWDLRFYYEVKANLRPQDIAILRAAGLVQIQPGIENLSSRVLKIMDKGVQAAQNVRLLRCCEENDITVDWNYLYGFPGETEQDYAQVLDQLPALAHLQPPGGSVRILLERYSPYFERPELGFLTRWPSSRYAHVYDLPEDVMRDLAYQFDTEELGIDAKTAGRVREAIHLWREAYPPSTLSRTRLLDGRLRIADRRRGWERRDITLDATQGSAYEYLDTPRTIAAAARGADVQADHMDRWIRGWTADGLVFRDENRYVALATSHEPIKTDAGTPGA